MATSDSISATPSANAFTVGHPSGDPASEASANPFVDRRKNSDSNGTSERRQFGSSHQGLSEAGRELALAIDRYKLEHHRRYITCDEMLLVIKQLGYAKT